MALIALSRAPRKSSTLISGNTSFDIFARRCFSSQQGVNTDLAIEHGHKWYTSASSCSNCSLLESKQGSWYSDNVRLGFGVLGGVGLGIAALNELNDCRRCAVAEGIQTLPTEEIQASTKGQYFLLNDSYRRRLFFNYEKRIRLRSTPEKVFNYFSSVKSQEGHPFMTPADLMRAVVPVFPPSGSRVIREGHLDGERPPGDLQCAPSKFFMLFDVNGDGLISFPEYIFFVTLLSIPDKEFSTVFKMFDLDGNGTIDRDEFKKVMTRMRKRTRQGAAQRNGLQLGLKVPDAVENGGLLEYFFGKDGKELLPLEEFETFMHDLHNEIILLEFSHYDFQNKGYISARDFGHSLIASADLSLIHQLLDRADLLSGDSYFKEIRISFQEFKSFAEFRKKIPVLAMAISNYGHMDKSDFQRAASTVCNLPLTDAVVDIIFHIFDLNKDGKLNSEEFLAVMERRERDIGNPTDTGLVRAFKCLWKCGQKSFSNYTYI